MYFNFLEGLVIKNKISLIKLFDNNLVASLELYRDAWIVFLINYS